MQWNNGLASYGISLVFWIFALVGPLCAQPLLQRQDVIRQEAPRQLLSPEQLDALVSPLALYPDPLLSQALAASTYPLELVEAEQWLQRHPDLHGSQSVEAAKQLNCDASVQVMVAFPDVLRLLTQNIRWTTDLGNAVLAQQVDVLDAIQRLRSHAQQNGYLTDTSQQVVTTQSGPVRNAISIQPADPQVMQVPAYVPEKVWGPPAAGEYPSLWYPAVSSGSGYGEPIQIGSILNGLLNWSGWGWGLNWLTQSLFQNASFFNSLGFPGFSGENQDSTGVAAWTHDPVHRLGAPYSNPVVASRFGGAYPGNGVAGYGTNRAAGSRGGIRNGVEPGAGYHSGPSEGWRFFGSHTAENAYRSTYRGGYSNRHAYGNMTEAGYRKPAGAPMGFRGDGLRSQEPRSGYRRSSDRNSTKASPPFYAFRQAPRQFSQGRRSEQHPSGGGHFSAPKSSGHFKPPKFSSRSSGRSSKGRSSGHGKSRHRR